MFDQDTVLVAPVQDTIAVFPQDTVTTDSLPLTEDSSRVDAIQLLFEQSNRRQEVLDSISRRTERPSYVSPTEEGLLPDYAIDSSHIIFSVDSPGTILLPGFDLDLPEYSYREQADEGFVFIEAPDDRSEALVQEKETTTVTPGPDQEFSGKEKAMVSDDWILGVILASFIVLAWVRLFYNKFLSPTIVAFINQQVSHNLFRDKSGVSMRVSSGLNLIFYLNGGLFLYLLVRQLDTNILGLEGFWLFSFFCVCLMGFYLTKQFISYLVGAISLTQKMFKEYMHNVFVYNKNIGLFFFPVILGIVYMPPFLQSLFFYAGLAIFGMAYLFRFIRGFQIFLKEGVSILYWILYLCALEILPILLFLKLSGLLVW
jgi:hypothetical protein